MIREAKARKLKKSLALMTVLVGLETFVAYIFVKYKLKLGKFSAEKYRNDVMRGAVDFARSGETLALVFDCPLENIELIREYLEQRCTRNELCYGMHVSDHAVMTCLVTSAVDDKHVHFADGGDGGYTKAARQLKARLKAV